MKRVLFLILSYVFIYGCEKENFINIETILDKAEKTIINFEVPDSLGMGEELIVKRYKEFFFIRLIPDWHIGIWNSDGKLINVLGNKGFGPKEFLKIGYFDICDDTLYIVDSHGERMHVYAINNNNFSFIESFSFDKLMGIMCFKKVLNENRYVLFCDGSVGYHIIIVDKLQSSFKETYMMKSSIESIRTEILLSQSISLNMNAEVACAFMAASDIFLLNIKNLFNEEISIDSENYVKSNAYVLKLKYESGTGFVKEVFENSRVISIGFLDNPSYLGLSFAKGRGENAKFYFQIYSKDLKKPVTNSVLVEKAIIYLDNGMFGCWVDGNEFDKNKKFKFFSLRINTMLQ